jgi:hypothetical protein
VIQVARLDAIAASYVLPSYAGRESDLPHCLRIAARHLRKQNAGPTKPKSTPCFLAVSHKADWLRFDPERLVQRGILVDHAVFYSHSDAADVADVGARITVHQDHVG